MTYSAIALGRAIRSLREDRTELSQQQLGVKAGYSEGPGAGVSISRVESGQMRPRGDRLVRLATALGVTEEALIKTAESLTPVVQAELEQAKREEANQRAGSGFSSGLPVKRRYELLKGTIDERANAVGALSDQLNFAHDRARDEYFLPFIEVAKGISGAPCPPEPEPLGEDDLVDPARVAEYRLGVMASRIANQIAASDRAAAVGDAVIRTATYGMFRSATLFGSASTGRAMAGLGDAAANRGTAVFLGGGGLAASSRVLGNPSGLVVAPAALLAAFGLVGYLLISRRSKQKELEAQAVLDEIEAELYATQDGYAALLKAIAGATDVLDYIGTHASHGMSRWNMRLRPDRPLEWSALADSDRRQYEGFLSVAACQISVANLNFPAFADTQGPDLDELIRSTQENLDHAKETVTQFV